ncbi:translocation/assembly module TamB domain-containing protein [Phenylobacterium sp.]|uniref:translocation/assembly module TamB domain-containing protein n=1 Tax=Phenylobacterium sp. TaxID=1871053 RepID=UPI0035AE3C74
MSGEETKPAPARRKPRHGLRIGLALAAAVALLVGLAVGARFAVLAPGVRHFIEAHVDGLKAGRVGRLQLSGLDGDLWRDFTVKRLAIADDKGVWIEAQDLHMRWRPSALWARTVAIDLLTAKQLRVLRRPQLGPPTGEGGMPVNVRIADLRTRVEMLPDFSYSRGLYDLTASLELRRDDEGQAGQVSAKSLLHAGDHVNARFDMGGKRPLLLDIDANEAKGGAVAGALGLPADQAFDLQVRASGRMSAGQFKARAVSGETTPLEAHGDWSEQGGQAEGRVSLTASSLTRGLAERLGDDVSFMLYGRKTPGELYLLDGRLSSANLTVTARGQGDIGERRTGPAGLAVSLSAADLSKLAGVEGFGPGRIDGALRGRADDLVFTGQADVGRVTTGAYQLAGLSGPVEFSRQGDDLALKLKFDGAGGAGQGYMAALLGAAPRLEMEARRLKNGRILLRQLSAKGSGLELDASGARTLLGALTFRGEARLFNLQAARPGAAGELTASWSADQSKADGPWRFGFDAGGKGLALGISELDRMLGAQPSLHGEAALEGRRLTVSDVRLNGAAVAAQSSGVVAEDGGLDFKLDWSASGPFHAGPVEVTGKAAGSGTLTGALATPKAELVADIDAIDVPRLPLKTAKLTLDFQRAADGASGHAALTAASDYGPARAQAAFAFPDGGLDLTDVKVQAGGVDASGSVSLRSHGASGADLDLAVGPGAFLESGRIDGQIKMADGEGGARALATLTAEDALFPGRSFAIHQARLSADGPLSHLPFVVTADGASRSGRWSLNGKGAYGDGALTFDGGGKLGRRELKTVETAHLQLAGAARGARMRLAASDGGALDIDARMTDGDADIKVKADGVDMGLFNEDLAGRANATLTLHGRGERLDGALDAELDGARGRGADPATGLNGVLHAKLDGPSLHIEAQGANSQGLKAQANLDLPAEASASPFRIALDRTKPVKGTFFADGEVRPLWDLFSDGERTLSGHVRMQGSLDGTLADPRAVGHAQVDGGRFADAGIGLVLGDVQLKADFADNAVSVSEATASDGHGGLVSGGGRMSLARNGASSFRLDLKGFRLIDNEQASATASGQATIDRGSDGKVRLSGALTIDQAEIAAVTPTPSGVVAMDVVEIHKPVNLESSLAAPSRVGPGIALDVSLKAPRRVFLRGRGLDVEFSMNAHVGGTTSNPLLTGEARVVRGDYEFAGKRFEFDPRGTVYLSTDPENVRLDLTATRSDTSLVAVVRILGAAAKPKITLTSTPVLPSDEVLSQVLFGTSASQLSPLEAAQLASALSSLAGGGGFDVIGGLRNFAGLDRLALGGGGQSAVTVSGGKYLTDDVYLELTGGGRDGASAQVEWRVRDSLSIISKVGGQGDAKLAVRWRKDY